MNNRGYLIVISIGYLVGVISAEYMVAEHSIRASGILNHLRSKASYLVGHAKADINALISIAYYGDNSCNESFFEMVRKLQERYMNDSEVSFYLEFYREEAYFHCSKNKRGSVASIKPTWTGRNSIAVKPKTNIHRFDPVKVLTNLRWKASYLLGQAKKDVDALISIAYYGNNSCNKSFFDMVSQLQERYMNDSEISYYLQFYRKMAYDYCLNNKRGSVDSIEPTWGL